MGSEFVTRKSSVWGKKSDTKPSLFASRPFSEPTREDDKVSKKELPKDIPPPNYIFAKMGFNAPQPVVQREEENSQEKESEQEADVNLKSDVSADDEENKVDLKADKSVNIPPPNYIFAKMGYKVPQPVIQREEENSQEKESEQEADVNLKSDVSAADENKEENINLKPAAPTASKQSEDEDNQSIQTKLTVGKPGDKYEQEADATAAKVMGMSDETLQRQSQEETEDIQAQQIPTLNTSPITEKGEEEQEIQTKGKGDRQQQNQPSSSLESRLGSSKGGGSPLADNVRGFMEPRFGADFGDVRVHNDSSAVQMNKELGAQAFAHGNDIYYAAGKSPGNNELTAHELTHTIQQTGGKLQRKANKLRLKSNIGTSNKIKPFERFGSKEADNSSNFEPENELQNKEQTEEQTKGEQKLKSNQVKTSKKNKASTPKAFPDEQNQKTQELKSQTPEAGKTEDVNSQKDAQGKQEQTKDKAVNGENPQNPPAQQPAAKPLQEQKGLDKEMTGNAAPATKAQATPGSGSGGGGSQVAGGGSGGDVGGEVNEEAEAKAMEQRMAEAETPEDSDSEQLSSPEKEIAVAAIAEDPVPGKPPSGGVGGEAISEQPQPQAPDVSQSEPSAALAAISHLPPTKLLSAIGGVSGAVTTTVGKQKEALVANPPTLETPSGAKSPASEVTKSVPEDKPKAVEKKPDGVAKPVPQPEPLPPQKSSPEVKTPPPAVQGNEKGELSESDVEKMQASISTMPVKDSGAMEISAGNPPQLELTGNANPQKAQEQKAELEKSLAETQAKGQQSLAQPMGEDAIVHSVPQRTLKAQIAGGAGDSGGGTASGGGGETDMGDTISILAQQEKGGEIQATAAKAQGEFATRKQEHRARVTEEKAQSHQYIEQLKLKNAEQQAQEKGKAKAEVQQMRGEWSKEQQTLVKESGTEANKLVNEGIKEIDSKKAEGEAEAQKEIHKGEQNAEQERKKGETEAAAERQKGERESSGLFGWLASKAKAFYEGIKQGIQKAFEAARAAMRQAIELAKSMAAKAIEKCRQAIVATIQRVGNALIAIGDKLLAQWPGLQKKWRDSIKKRVEQAEAAVNKLAQDLNQGIQKGLDLLGKGLDAALGLMEKGMLAAVSVYEGAVMGAIKFGEGAAKALGAFAVLATDIGANPGQWIGNLGGAVSDGIKNHLWNAFQQQVQAWFNQKLEAVLGLGTAVWKILTQGGISMAEVGKMAWTGVKQALPMIIIGVLLERLVSMIVPAAGAVLAVIQGLQAAWGTVNQIIQAFGQFMTFLKAVKTGNAGPQFGAVLASAAIVLLEFITNFIIVKIAKAARKVAGKLKGLAKNLMKRGKGKKRTKGYRSSTSSKTRKKHKNKQKQKDKKDKFKQEQIARDAARRGWKTARSVTSKRAVNEASLIQQLQRVRSTRKGIRVSVKPQRRGTTWSVKATATKSGKQKTATAGRGWVAKNEQGLPFYVGLDLTSFNSKLIREAFVMLKKKNNKAQGNNLKEAYQQKLRESQDIEKHQQTKLNRKIRGLIFRLKMEPFSGVEKDKKIRTKAIVTPNMSNQVEEIPVEVTEFAERFKVGKPRPDTPVKSAKRPQVSLRKIKKSPMLGKESMSGYVVNMAATPKETQAGMASRYFNDAWEGGKADLAKSRTAVIIGINSFRSIDPKKERQMLSNIQRATKKVNHPHKSLVAVFGFAWEPHWTDNGSSVSVDKVRTEWQKLPAKEKEQARAKTEKDITTSEKLPYGIFRNQVIESKYTRKAVKFLNRVTDPVHVLTQDADGSVKGEEDGILAEYDKFLKDVRRHPLMTIGGYRFSGFGWGNLADSRTAQLTELANAIDRAIRVAIAKVYPEMLYPTEPNMLIKAGDKKNRDGIFNKGSSKSLFGHGYSEGRTAKINILKNNKKHPKPVGYAPGTSPTTSPEPDRPQRGLTVREEDVPKAISGELYKDITDAKKIKPETSHEYMIIETQSQNASSPGRLTQELANVRGIKRPLDKKLRDKIFGSVRNIGKALTEEPSLTSSSPKIGEYQENLDQNAKGLKENFANKEQQETIDIAHNIVKEIIKTMTSKELKPIWEKLRQVLDEINSQDTKQRD